MFNVSYCNKETKFWVLVEGFNFLSYYSLESILFTIGPLLCLAGVLVEGFPLSYYNKETIIVLV